MTEVMLKRSRFAALTHMRPLRSSAQVIVFDQIILFQLGDSTLKHDFAMHDNVTTVGDADRLVKILFRHQYGESVAYFQFLDLVIVCDTSIGARPTEGSSTSSNIGEDISARDGEHLLLPAGHRACQVAVALLQQRKRFIAEGDVFRDVLACLRTEGAEQHSNVT